MKLDCVPVNRRRTPDFKLPCVLWKKTVPFLVNPRAHLVHRVRAAKTWLSDSGKPRHSSAKYWCGNVGKGQFLEFPPPDMLVCAICEANAILHGQPSSSELAGRHVHIGRANMVQVCCVQALGLMSEVSES